MVRCGKHQKIRDEEFNGTCLHESNLTERCLNNGILGGLGIALFDLSFAYIILTFHSSVRFIIAVTL